MTSYFKPDQREILKLIGFLTLEKRHTDLDEISKNIPEEWKLKGCGTGNLQNALLNLYKKKLIATTVTDEEFYAGSDISNKPLHLAKNGLQELQPWYKKRKFWVLIFAAITALATLGTFLLSLLTKFRGARLYFLLFGEYFEGFLKLK